MVKSNKHKTEKGVIGLVFVFAVVAIIIAVVGYFYLTDTSEESANTRSVQNVYFPDEATDEISDSDKTSDIETELESTDLELNELEDALDDLESELDSL